LGSSMKAVQIIEYNHQELIATLDLVAQGKIKPVIGARYPLSRINEAAKKLEEGEVVGRIILTR
jgi:D-arabinose 1-dehydrogenase-like Zn-dependent alcohol dehydrogenase